MTAIIEGVDGSYDVWLCKSNGVRLVSLNDFSALSIVKTVSAPGAFSITLPPTFMASKYLLTDMIVEIWRTPSRGAQRPEFTGFVRKWSRYQDGIASTKTTLSGVGPVDLLKRRIIAYYAGSAQSEKTDSADDMMKAVIRENLGSSAGAGRDLSAYSFSVAADTSKAPSITKGFSWQNVYEICTKIAEASAAAGTPLYFDVIASQITGGALGFTFMTYTGQRGRDLTTSRSTRVGFEYGNVSSITHVIDKSDEANYVYGGGQGEGSDRLTSEASDSAAIKTSRWNRREAFKDARSAKTQGELDAATTELLESKAAKLGFDVVLKNTDSYEYGLEWDWGDKLYIEFDGQSFVARIQQVDIRVDNSGQESISARVEADV